MKLFAVRSGQRLERFFMGTAETPEEAVMYAIAKDSMFADEYVVYDHDLNRFVVSRPKTLDE